MKDNLLIRILLLFAPLSFLTIGGGQSIVADIHRQTVSVHHWMSDSQFLNLFALARLTPGPNSLLVTLIGWQVAGWGGAILASLAIFLPSSLLVYALAKLWERHNGAPWQKAVEMGLAPVAAGMILSSVFVLLRSMQGGLLAWAVALISGTVLLFTRISPFILLGGGALVFLCFWH